jgi:UDP-2,3-diacylglucosamine pyrophosphatase LpxH
MSDLHLGTSECRSGDVLKFLKENTFSKLYLVGDIIDIEAMRYRRNWTQSHNDVVQKILRLARKGVQVIYVIGNHDIFLSKLLSDREIFLGNLTILNDDIHITSTGSRCLIMHGHQLDGSYEIMKWLYRLGDRAYEIAIKLNRIINITGRFIGLPHMPISKWLKMKVKNAVSYLGAMEEGISRYAALRGVNSVICGHLHHPQSRNIGDIQYINCGDFVESSTVAVELEELEKV